MPKAKYLCWVDLETTGLDEYKDQILEAGVVITEITFPFQEKAAATYTIKPESPDWTNLLSPYVREMHTVNGLIEDVLSSGRRLIEVENDIIHLLGGIGSKHDFMLAGSGVAHFDRRFIKTRMKRFDSWLQHPALDVGVIRRALDFSGRKDLDAFGNTFDSVDKPHRGLPDVRDHLNEMREYASLFSTIPTQGESNDNEA